MDHDLISIGYFFDRTALADLGFFDRENGFSLYLCDHFSIQDESGYPEMPGKLDLVLVDLSPESDPAQLLKALPVPVESSVIFAVCERYPEEQYRKILFENGFKDILTVPFSMSEIKARYRIYGQTADAIRQKEDANRKMQKSVSALSRFEQQAEKLKQELFEDRTSLAGALKQIQQMILERKRTKNELEELQQQLTDNIEGFLDILYRLVHVRLEENRGHAERVSHICEFVGKQFDLDEKKLDDLKKAAMLHEIGLLFIPGAILQKPENQRSHFEKDLFEQYPVKGADLLSDCPGFKKASDIVRHLHENSDGTGYPEGLKRRYIPLGARILAGADVFDVLRDKQEISNLEEFLEELETYSAGRLDPTVVGQLEKYAVLHMSSGAYKVKGMGVHQLEPGMKLGAAIFTNTGTKLFSVNTLLTPDAIDKIKKYNREYPVDETVYIRA